MKIKVCGMKDPHNIEELAKLPIDYMGFIFYGKSARYIDDLQPKVLNKLPATIDRVGVFVDEALNTVINQIEKYGLNVVQLHGNESPEYCSQCCNLTDVEVIKVFNISSVSDFEQVRRYENICDYFLFDTKTSQHGGSGQKFDWNLLKQYRGETPFFLSGGISSDDADSIKSIMHPKLYGIDLNSCFETEPGMKDINLLEIFLRQIIE